MAKAFSEILKANLGKSGIRQKELAEDLGETKQSVSAWLSGKAVPSVKALKLMAKKYEWDYDELVKPLIASKLIKIKKRYY